ncbi:MAG: glycosyltransferase family 4 protein [Leadbetterella sp.]|nr:glycosyltransferase family 4 protein [Leadbetterella sp.]
MEYILIAAALLILLLFYFRIADRYNIIDRPNERSSHTQVTLRGAGVIFYAGVMLWFFRSGGMYPWFFAGLTAISLISFLDDVYTLSNRIRLSVHLLSVLLMMYQLELLVFHWYGILMALILVIGIINAYNFMDGINGITAAYSFAVLLLLWWVNREVAFIDDRLLYYTALANAVFTFYNFRNKARCFAGDVGSVSMSFILIFAVASLMIKTGNPVYIMFFAVYGADTVLTIIHRLFRRENIFKAHRLHLFQYLANEAGGNRLVISFAYGVLQLLIGYLVLRMRGEVVEAQLIVSAMILFILCTLYVGIKGFIVKKYALRL